MNNVYKSAFLILNMQSTYMGDLIFLKNVLLLTENLNLCSMKVLKELMYCSWIEISSLIFNRLLSKLKFLYRKSIDNFIIWAVNVYNYALFKKILIIFKEKIILQHIITFQFCMLLYQWLVSFWLAFSASSSYGIEGRVFKRYGALLNVLLLILRLM